MKNLTLLSTSLTCCLVAVSAEAKTSQPNIILIMVDDMGYGDFGCFGNKVNKTPNIDNLAAQGAKLTDFHSNGPVSSPTRAALMTGRYQQFYGVEAVIKAAGDRDKGLDPSAVTIGKLLQKNNYETVIYGKWHLGYQLKHNPINYGFDEFKGYIAGNVDYFSHIDLAGNADWWFQDKLTPDEGYTTHLLTEYAEEFLSRKHKKPFFLYLPYEACHTPLQGPEDEAYRVEGKAMGNPPAKRPNNVVYKEMTEAFDDCVGRIMNKLKEEKLDKNTFVIFFSDNGGSVGATCAPLSGKKGSMLEGGHRVSCVAYWPGKIKPGTVIDETILTMDILPTLCEMTGTKAEGVFDGVSFLPTLLKGEKMPERTVFWRINNAGAARRGDWKIVINVGTRVARLYNLKDDLAEKKDLAATHPQITKELVDEFTAWEASHAHISQISDAATKKRKK